MTILPGNADFAVFMSVSIAGPTGSVVHGQCGTAGERRLLRKFIALFLEIKCVFSIALGD